MSLKGKMYNSKYYYIVLCVENCPGKRVLSKMSIWHILFKCK